MRLTNCEIKEIVVLRAIVKKYAVNSRHRKPAERRLNRYLSIVAKKNKCSPANVLQAFERQRWNSLQYKL